MGKRGNLKGSGRNERPQDLGNVPLPFDDDKNRKECIGFAFREFAIYANRTEICVKKRGCLNVSQSV